jgi:hypothetical protein
LCGIQKGQEPEQRKLKGGGDSVSHSKEVSPFFRKEDDAQRMCVHQLNLPWALPYTLSLIQKNVN